MLYLDGMNDEALPRLLPTGRCWCGCGTDTPNGSFFTRGHDKVAEAAFLALRYQGSVAQLLQAHGFDADRSVTAAAADEPDCSWDRCPTCRYPGNATSIANHRRRAGH